MSAVIEKCAICGGLWGEQRIVHQIVMGKERSVCMECLREGLHP